MANARIMIVAPDKPGANDVRERLENLGHTVSAIVSSEQQAVDGALQRPPEMVIIDLAVDGGLDGIEAASQMRSFGIPVLCLTDGTDSDLLQRASTAGVYGYVFKPADERQLRPAIETALHLHGEKTMLADRLRRLSMILDSVDAAVLAIDADGFVTFVNPLAESMLERRQAELSGVLLPDIFHVVPEKHVVPGEAVDNEQNIMTNILHWGARVSGSSATLTTKTGRKTIVNYHAAPVKDAQMNCIGAIVVFQSGTKAQQMEQELKRTVINLQSRLRLMETVFESLSDGVAVADKQGYCLLANHVAQHGFGVELGNWGKDIKQWPEHHGVYHSDGKTPLPLRELPLLRAMHGEASDIELFLHNSSRPEGVHISVSGRPLVDEINGIDAGVIVMRDITERKATDRELQESVDELQQQTRLMQAIFEGMSDGVVVADENGKFTLFNPAAKRIVGMGLTDTDPDQWSAKYGIFYNDRTTPVPTDDLPLVRAVRGEATDEVEIFIRNAFKPEGVHLSVSGRPIVSSGVPRGGVIVFRDVTEKVRADEALAHAFAQGRLEILDTILHNIGNAVNSVAVGIATLQKQLARNSLLRRFLPLSEAAKAHHEDWNEYVRDDPKGQKVRPFLVAFADTIAQQNQQMLSTVERVSNQASHIVDIVRTQRGFGNNSTRKDINLREAVASALRIMHGAFRRRGIRTRLNFGNAPEEIRIQESQFHQMLINLLKNAMEATDELKKSGGLNGLPRIELRAYLRREFLVMDVIDNGIGIAQKDLRAIFAAGYTTKPLGSGLGLHSTANFITGSGGKILPFSDGFGQGTTMRVMLRLDAVRQPGTEWPDAVESDPE